MLILCSVPVNEFQWTASSWSHKSGPWPSISRWLHILSLSNVSWYLTKPSISKGNLSTVFVSTSDHKLGLSALVSLGEMKKGKMNNLMQYKNLYFKTPSCEEIFVSDWWAASLNSNSINWVHKLFRKLLCLECTS